MNLVLHGDGSTNVFRVDSVKSPGEWDSQEARNRVPYGKVDIVMTNPPFGGKAKIKPGGYLAILIPDGILNNPGLKFIRSWLLKRSQLIASIDLPKTTFKASGGVNNPSVLLVRKFTRSEAENAEKGIIDNAYDVFMASPETCGIDNRVAPVYLRHPDGREKQDENGQKVKDDQVSAIAEKFSDWWNSPSRRK